MITATVSELKKELKNLPKEDLANLCIKLASFKKENKELLTYLLFESENEERYIRSIKDQVEEEFKGVNKNTLYFAKKTIRKILRIIKKYIKYSGKVETEIELLIFFCEQIKETKLPIHESKVLINLYQRQIELIKKSQIKLHEDLQYDYEERINALML